MPPRAAQPGGAAGARGGRAARAAEGPGRALPGRRRVHRRARGARWPARYVATVAAAATRSARARGGGPAQLARGSRSIALVAARARRRSRSAPTCCCTPDRRPVPDVVGKRSAAAAQTLQSAGFEVDIVPIQSDTVRRGPGRRPAARAGRGGRRGLDGDDHRVERAGRGAGAGRPGPAGRRGRPTQLREAGFRSEQRREFSDTVPRRAGDRDVAAGGLERPQGRDGHAGRLARHGAGRGARRRRAARATRRSATLQDAGLRASRSARRSPTDEEPGTVLRAGSGGRHQVAQGQDGDARRGQGAGRGAGART